MGFPLTSGFGLGVNAAGLDTRMNIYGINERRMALANQVDPNTPPGELLRVFQEDKQLALQKIQADVNDEYLYQWGEQLRERQKRERDRHEQRIANGWLFA